MVMVCFSEFILSLPTINPCRCDDCAVTKSKMAAPFVGVHSSGVKMVMHPLQVFVDEPTALSIEQDEWL